MVWFMWIKLMACLHWGRRIKRQLALPPGSHQATPLGMPWLFSQLPWGKAPKRINRSGIMYKHIWMPGGIRSPTGDWDGCTQKRQMVRSWVVHGNRATWTPLDWKDRARQRSTKALPRERRVVHSTILSTRTQLWTWGQRTWPKTLHQKHRWGSIFFSRSFEYHCLISFHFTQLLTDVVLYYGGNQVVHECIACKVIKMQTFNKFSERKDRNRGMPGFCEDEASTEVPIEMAFAYRYNTHRWWNALDSTFWETHLWSSQISTPSSIGYQISVN